MDYIEAFEEIVDSIRSVGAITNITNTTLTSTITSDNSLIIGEWVAMDSVDYMVKSATSTQFTVDGIGITTAEWKALAPYSMFDTVKKVVNRLTVKDSNNLLKYQKYPLIVLRLPNVENEGGGFSPVINNITFDIMTPSKIVYWGEERKSKTFDPILRPIKEDFIQAIKDYPYINEDEGSLLRGSKDDYLLGSDTNANILNDIVDVTTIIFDKLSFLRQCK